MTAVDKRFDFTTTLDENNLELRPISVETLWVNITRRCNQTCTHCHVGASPDRREHMNRSVIDRCLEVLANNESIENLDITGGAPELHPDFEYLVSEARKLGKHVIVRHNLTVTFDGDPKTGANKEYLPDFFADSRVEVLASLPHYIPNHTDRIRGPGVFRKSLYSLRRLNALGYGQPGTDLILNIVHNFDGPLLPTQHAEIEERFRQRLFDRYGLVFNRLFSVTNMPINRYRNELENSGNYIGYLDRLVTEFSPSAAEQVVCRSIVSVGYDGRLYDCDFNQMLDMQIVSPEPLTIFNAELKALLARKIRFGSHCFGCTAGGGSS